MAKILISVLRPLTSDFRLLQSGFLIFVLVSISLTIVFPFPVSAQEGFHFVSCGRDTNDSGKLEDFEQCEFSDLVILIVRVINYLISVAAIVAMYQILLAGWNLMTALGNPEKIEHGKEGISHAVVGLAIIVLAFVFVNLLVNGIFGKEGSTRPWWDTECIYNPGKAECPFNPESAFNK